MIPKLLAGKWSVCFRLQVFLGTVAAVLWLVSYLASLATPDTYDTTWWGALSAVAFIGAVVATAVVLIVSAVNIVEPLDE